MSDTGHDDPRSDLDLIGAFQAGDGAAFEVLYRRHRDWVVRLAYRFTGDPDLALDVLQETFLYFLKKVPGFQLTARFTTFLYPVVRNLSLTARNKWLRLQGDPTVLESLESSVGSRVSSLEWTELREALSGLPEEQRETLWLRFVDGFSLAEIALAMGVPLGTVKSRLHHALGTLRQDGRTKKFFFD